MLPPIRYPLPSLIALVAVTLLAWRGEAWTRGWRSELSDRLQRVVHGPPVPSSHRPQVVAGPITRRALLLRDETAATSRPGGPTVETISRRMFMDIYDVWPAPGPATHLRVGNRKPMGWIKATDCLEWDTRLVIRPRAGRLRLSDSPDGPVRPEIDVGNLTLPVLAWTSAQQAAEVAVWDPTRPWSLVTRRGWVKGSDLPPGAWGVWISQVELPVLLRQAIDGDPNLVRLRAVLGRLTDNRPLSAQDLGAARRALPPLVFTAGLRRPGAMEKLAEANSRPASEAGWSGLSFRFLPIDDLP